MDRNYTQDQQQSPTGYVAYVVTDSDGRYAHHYESARNPEITSPRSAVAAFRAEFAVPDADEFTAARVNSPEELAARRQRRRRSRRRIGHRAHLKGE